MARDDAGCSGVDPGAVLSISRRGSRPAITQHGTATVTYNAPDRHLGGVTFGGYSESIVVDTAYDRLLASDVKHRSVIDMASLKAE